MPYPFMNSTQGLVELILKSEASAILEHALDTILRRGYEGRIFSVTIIVYPNSIDNIALGDVLEYSKN